MNNGVGNKTLSEIGLARLTLALIFVPAMGLNVRR